MYVIIWEYQVEAKHFEAFEELYGAEGEWARLFQNHPGYLGTELLHDSADLQRYLTIDRWASAEAYNSFHAEWQDEYRELDARCQRLTDSESFLGTLLLV